MTEKFISIIVPVYNVSTSLCKCIDSILSQVSNMQDVEILLVNDGSTDDSGKICDEYKSKYSNQIKVYHKKNEGLLLTRRFGYKKAVGKYIINCDSDDTLEEDAVPKLRHFIELNDVDIVIFNINLLNDDSKRVYYKDVFTEGSYCNVNKKDLLNNFMTKNQCVSMCGKIFKKSCLDLSRDYSQFYKESLGEDTLQSMELYSNARNIMYLNESLYNYYEGSGMTKKFNLDYFEKYTLVNNYLKNYKKDFEGHFDSYYAEKLYVTVGRSIVQLWYSDLSFKSMRSYLKKINTNEDVILYKNKLKTLNIKKKYIYLTYLLLYKQYLIIYLLVKAKKILK